MSPYRFPAGGYDLVAPPPTPEAVLAAEAVRVLEDVFGVGPLDALGDFADTLLVAGRRAQGRPAFDPRTRPERIASSS